MLFGLDGVEIGLIIVFLCLFGGILSGFPVAFAIGGAAVISFGIIAAMDSAGLLIHQAIDTSSEAFRTLTATGVNPDSVSIFRYPDLPRIGKPVFEQGWEIALDRNISFIVNRMNERVFAGQSIETLLAVLMFVLMGITLERSKIAEDLRRDGFRLLAGLRSPPRPQKQATTILAPMLRVSSGLRIDSNGRKIRMAGMRRPRTSILPLPRSSGFKVPGKSYPTVIPPNTVPHASVRFCFCSSSNPSFSCRPVSRGPGVLTRRVELSNARQNAPGRPNDGDAAA